MEHEDHFEFEQCPYVPSHRILKNRFQVHLTRCRRNHKNVPKSVCPFNVTHLLNEPELEWHVANCPNRSTFETYKNQDVKLGLALSFSQPTSTSKGKKENDEFVQLVECSENWDDEPDVPSYNPNVYCENARILRKIEGAKPSERKEFRKQEQRRMMLLNQQKK